MSWPGRCCRTGRREDPPGHSRGRNTFYHGQKAPRRKDLENRKIDYQAALAKLNSNPNLRKLSEEEKRIIIDNILLAPFLDLTDDFAFKKVLGNNASILRVLLSDILDEDIVEVTYRTQ